MKPLRLAQKSGGTWRLFAWARAFGATLSETEVFGGVCDE